MELEAYEKVHKGLPGYHISRPGVFRVWGSEAIAFLDGLLTNNVKKLQPGQSLLAAFPTPQGRLIAVVKVHRAGEEILLETEEATRKAVYAHLHRFTFAGDFNLRDESEQYLSVELYDFENKTAPISDFKFSIRGRADYLIHAKSLENVLHKLNEEGVLALDDQAADLLRLECGIPRFGKEIDESVVVPEIGIPEMISYTKGCYAGQEIIARIHFRGHVAKLLSGLIFRGSEISDAGEIIGSELNSEDGKSAGKLFTAAFSPHLDSYIGMGFVRWDFLEEGRKLFAGKLTAEVVSLPFIKRKIASAE
jgi:folate-binding protein YgfZ